jgi:hypothetical protein
MILSRLFEVKAYENQMEMIATVYLRVFPSETLISLRQGIEFLRLFFYNECDFARPELVFAVLLMILIQKGSPSR